MTKKPSAKTPTSDPGGALPTPPNRRATPYTFTSQPALPAKREVQAASPALDTNGRPPRTPGTGGRKA